MYRIDSSNFSMFKKRIIDKYYAYEHDAFKMSTIKQTIINIPGSTYKPEDDLLRGTLEKWSDSTYTQISAGAFLNQFYLSCVSFPNITSIGSYAFGNCKQLKSINIDKVTQIGDYAFASCGLLSLAAPACENAGVFLFLNCGNQLNTIDMPKLTNCSSGFTFCNMVIQDDGTYISYSTVLSLPKLSIIGSRTFDGNAADLVLPALTTLTATTAFQSVEASIIKLGNSSLTQYPTISANVFGSTIPNLKNLYLQYNKVLSMVGAQPAIAPDTQIHVWPSLVESYKTATGWSSFATQIVPITE